MNIKRISIVAALMVATFCFKAHAQPNEKMPIFIKNYGFSGFGFLDFTSPVYKNLSTNNSVERAVVPNLLSLTWGWRANLIESGDHFSVSLETNPMLQVSVAAFHNGYMSVGAFELPVMLGINWGTAATFRSIDFKGGGLSAGISIMKYPLFSSDYDFEFEETGFNNYDILYCFSYKMRRWTMQNASEGRGKSLEFYFAFGATHEFSDQSVMESSFLKDRPVRAGLVFRKLLNY
jgi:hypothetical protein